MTQYISIFSLICIGLIVYTYLIYPFLLIVLYSFRKKEIELDQLLAYEPIVSCIIAVYNEEAVILDKLKSLFASNYPSHKLFIFVGSDASTDGSNEIIISEFKERSNCYFFEYRERSGKSSVINRLLDEVFKLHPPGIDHLILYTDANVLLEENAIQQFAASFVRDEIALVDSRIIQKSLKSKGISTAEKKYMKSESFIKHLEGELWGLSMGAFGGCYALRSTFGIKIPDTILVDDFYISLMTMIKGGKSITNPKALCYETIPDDLAEEFRRKKRISAGNFQNLSIFSTLLGEMNASLVFVLFSHKVLRWFGPFFLLGLQFSGIYFILFTEDWTLLLGLCLILVFNVLPVLDFILKYFGMQFKLLRGWTYFVIMNIALLFGFFRYLFGIQRSSWQPPKRV